MPEIFPEFSHIVSRVLPSSPWKKIQNYTQKKDTDASFYISSTHYSLIILAYEDMESTLGVAFLSVTNK
jgi:hypothetical protein